MTFSAGSYSATKLELLSLEADIRGVSHFIDRQIENGRMSYSRRCISPCVRAYCWHLLHTSSRCHIHIVDPRHSGSDTRLVVSPMYVELFNEASKYVFVVGISARRDCGADIGGGSCPASQTPLIDSDTQETPSPLTTASTGNQHESTLPSASEWSPVLLGCQRRWEIASALLSIGARKVESIPKRRTSRRSCLTLTSPSS